ncbi:MAG: VPLPA-CTERM sorting domain-containing protein [Gammaproteobacteria bacterium]|nr:VPLPA-CTERM sorting domain-containing protein [Gammaproteobacteria bacterium]
MKKTTMLYMIFISCLSAVPALAATVSLVATSSEVETGELFTVDLVLDAADAPGNHPGSFRGKVTVDFGSNASYDSFSYSGPAVALGAESTTATTVSLGFDSANDVGVIGTFQFTSSGAAGDTITLGIQDRLLFLGSFFNTDPVVTAFTPEFFGNSIDITDVPPIPVPGAVWLMGSALGFLGFMRRRIKTC